MGTLACVREADVQPPAQHKESPPHEVGQRPLGLVGGQPEAPFEAGQLEVGLLIAMGHHAVASQSAVDEALGMHDAERRHEPADVAPEEGAWTGRAQVPEPVLRGKRLVSPTRLDNLEARSISRAIDDIILEVGRSVPSRAGAFILRFSQGAGLGEAVYDATGGQIPTDEYYAQLDWVRADLDGGATLFVPRVFDPGRSRLQLVTETMIYQLGPPREEGAPVVELSVLAQGATFRASDYGREVVVSGSPLSYSPGLVLWPTQPHHAFEGPECILMDEMETLFDPAIPCLGRNGLKTSISSPRSPAFTTKWT